MSGKGTKFFFYKFSAVIFWRLAVSQVLSNFFFIFVWVEIDSPPDKRLLANASLLCYLRHCARARPLIKKNFQSVKPTAHSSRLRGSIVCDSRINQVIQLKETHARRVDF